MFYSLPVSVVERKRTISEIFCTSINLYVCNNESRSDELNILEVLEYNCGRV